MPYFDRSMFLEELKRNPSLITRMNTIVNGEVGHGASLDKKMIQLETIFNRAQARGQSLEKVTREYTGPGSDGYYPRSTFSNGTPRSQNEANSFNELVLKPVLGGSDRSTEVLGFAATGNASAGVAERGKNSGRYTRHGRVTPQDGETYVQEGRFDNIDRLNQYASGGTIPRPPADIPMTNAQYTSAQPNTRDIQGAYPGRNYQPPTQIGVEGGAERVPLPQGRPLPGAVAPQAAPPSAPARSQDIVQGMRKAIGDLLGGQGGPVGFPGSRDDVPIDARGLGTYTDPNTGHRIMNPGGSGEEAMGITRDLGRPGLSPFFARPPAPAPQRPAPSRTVSPPDQRRAGNPPAGPVSPSFPDMGGVTADEMQRRPLMPFDPRAFDTTPTASAAPPSLSGLTPGGMPMAEDPIGMFDVKQPSARSLSIPGLLALTSGGVPSAPELAGTLAAPAPSTRPPQRPEPVDASAAFSRGGNILTPGYAPTTVEQQLGGLSPFSTTPQQNGFASMTLLPFNQWPPLDFGSFNWAGPSSFSFGGWG